MTLTTPPSGFREMDGVPTVKLAGSNTVPVEEIFTPAAVKSAIWPADKGVRKAFRPSVPAVLQAEGRGEIWALAMFANAAIARAAKVYFTELIVVM
jgi:hypothetical protein